MTITYLLTEAHQAFSEVSTLGTSTQARKECKSTVQHGIDTTNTEYQPYFSGRTKSKLVGLSLGRMPARIAFLQPQPPKWACLMVETNKSFSVRGTERFSYRYCLNPKWIELLNESLDSLKSTYRQSVLSVITSLRIKFCVMSQCIHV